MRRWLRTWRPALRIARREALRARGRSALVVAMITLPILTMTCVDVLARSAQLEPGERLARQLGATQARVELPGAGPLEQAPDPARGWQSAEVAGAGAAPAPDVRAALPRGARVLTGQTGAVDTRTAAGVGAVDWNEVAVGDRAFAGRFRTVAGHAPRTAGQVAVTSRLLDRLGASVGDRVHLVRPRRTVTVTGVVDEVGSPTYQTYWALPGTLIGHGVEATTLPTLYVDGPAVTWAGVRAINAQGGLVLSRQVARHPPATADVPYLRDGNGAGSSNDWVLLALIVTTVVVLAGLEVTLLAGAAFAVGARRQARSLGLVAAAGGSRADVRRVVLGTGLVLGAAAAVTGVGLGAALAAVAMPTLSRVAGADFGHYDVRPLELLAIALLGVATGLLAAVLPARTASRQDPVVALTGRRGQVRTARKVPVIGLVLTGLGIGAAMLGSALAVALTTGLNPANGQRTALVAGLIAGGAAVAQIGLIVTSPAIIGLAARLGSRLPLPGRLAVRDAARHRGRSAPALAAVLTAVTGSTALLLFVASMDSHDRAAYQPTWKAQQGGLDLVVRELHPVTRTQTSRTIDPVRAERALRTALPPFRATVVRVVDDSCGADACPYALPVALPGSDCAGSCDTGVDTSYSPFENTPVGGPALLRRLAGRSDPAAVSALRQGGVVVYDRQLVRHGTVAFDVVTQAAADRAQQAGTEAKATRVVLPGAYLRPDGVGSGSGVWSAAAAARLGQPVHDGTLLMSFARTPTTAEQDAATAALGRTGVDGAALSVERGYVSHYGLGLLALVVGAAVITLGATGVATGLAQADARADHATLAAVGAAPRLRRTLAAAQALTIALLGTALGIAAGFVPALALIGAVDTLHVVLPWGRLATVLVGIPLLAAALAWLLTRSRVPLERRTG